MKNIIIFLAMFIVFGAKAQIVDVSYKGSRAARCVPFLINPLMDTTQVTHVGIKRVTADYTGVPLIALEYLLGSDSGSVISTNTFLITGADYLSWYNSADKNLWFFNYIRSQIKDNDGNMIITYQ